MFDFCHSAVALNLCFQISLFQYGKFTIIVHNDLDFHRDQLTIQSCYSHKLNKV